MHYLRRYATLKTIHDFVLRGNIFLVRGGVRWRMVESLITILLYVSIASFSPHFYRGLIIII